MTRGLPRWQRCCYRVSHEASKPWREAITNVARWTGRVTKGFFGCTGWPRTPPSTPAVPGVAAAPP